jgi:hypothetical protein
MDGVVVYINNDEYIAGCFIEDVYHAKVLIERTVAEDGSNLWEMRSINDFRETLDTKLRRAFNKQLKMLIPLDARYVDLWLKETNSNMWDIFEGLRFNPRHRPSLISLYK